MRQLLLLRCKSCQHCAFNESLLIVICVKLKPFGLILSLSVVSSFLIFLFPKRVKEHFRKKGLAGARNKAHPTCFIALLSLC